MWMVCASGLQPLTGRRVHFVPDISLVMPVWRPRAEWLHEAVRSALDQRDCDLELIVVDDGNDDAVSDMLADVIDPRMRHIKVAHGGVSARGTLV